MAPEGVWGRASPGSHPSAAAVAPRWRRACHCGPPGPALSKGGLLPLRGDLPCTGSLPPGTAPWAWGGRADPALWRFPGHALRSNRPRVRASLTRCPASGRPAPSTVRAAQQAGPARFRGPLGAARPHCPQARDPGPAPWEGAQEEHAPSLPGAGPGPGGRLKAFPPGQSVGMSGVGLQETSLWRPLPLSFHARRLPGLRRLGASSQEGAAGNCRS